MFSRWSSISRSTIVGMHTASILNSALTDHTTLINPPCVMHRTSVWPIWESVFVSLSIVRLSVASAWLDGNLELSTLGIAVRPTKRSRQILTRPSGPRRRRRSLLTWACGCTPQHQIVKGWRVDTYQNPAAGTMVNDTPLYTRYAVVTDLTIPHRGSVGLDISAVAVAVHLSSPHRSFCLDQWIDIATLRRGKLLWRDMARHYQQAGLHQGHGLHSSVDLARCQEHSEFAIWQSISRVSISPQ